MSQPRLRTVTAPNAEPPTHGSSHPDFRGRTYEPTDLSPHQTAHATALRVPILTEGNPRWRYMVGIVVAEPAWGRKTLPPTDDEVRAVASFLDEMKSRLTSTWRAHMAAFAPYDIDCGANSVWFQRWADNGGWAYQRYTWRHGPVPGPLDKPLTLPQVMDREHAFGNEPSKTWERWKSDHRDVFDAVAGDAR